MDHPQDGGSTAEVTVMATDAAGRVLHCVVEQSLRIHDQNYGILSPVDTPAYLCRWTDDDASEEPQFIDDPYQYPKVLDELDVILRDEDLLLVRSAGLLTVAGDLSNVAMDMEMDDDLLNDEDLDNGVMGAEEDEEDLDTYFVLASTSHGGAEFGLYGSLDPCFLVARLGQDTAELLPPEALAELQPLLEEALAHDEEVDP